MPALPPKKRSNRRVKFRDVAQFDVVRGVERSRKWPDPKLSNQTPAQLEQQDWFRQANWAFKYMDGNIQAVIRKAVHLTALYPRDLFTIMAANRLFALKNPEGRILYPMPARQDVSASLDTLGQSEGYILVRGPQFWEAVPQPAPVAGANWQLLNSWTQSIDGNTSQVTADLTGMSDCIVLMNNVGASISGRRSIELSDNGGASWGMNTGNWLRIASAGTLTAAEPRFYLHDTDSASARYGSGMMTGLNLADQKQFMCQRTTTFGIMQSAALPNFMRVFSTAGGALNSGSIRIYGR